MSWSDRGDCVYCSLVGCLGVIALSDWVYCGHVGSMRVIAMIIHNGAMLGAFLVDD